jgi:Tfp pilus assembly protein PilO
MRLKPTKSTLAFLGGAMGLLVLAIGGILWFLNGQLSLRSDDLHKREAELNDGQKIAKRRERAQAELEQDRQQILFLESSVSDAVYVPTMLKQIEDLAKSTNNQVLAVRPQVIVEAPTKLQQRRDPNAQDKQAAAESNKDGDKKDEKKPEPYTRLGIGLSVIGNYRSTEMFIEKLNRFPKIVSVDEIQLHPHRQDRKEQNPNAELEVELKLTAFIMKTPTSRTAGSAVTASADLKGSN